MPRDAEPTLPEPDPNTTWRPAPGASGRPKSAATRPQREREPEPISPSGGPNWAERVVFGNVGAKTLSTFCRQFGSYLDAGVDPKKALLSLEAQFARTALGPIVGRLILAVRKGETLSDAMAAEPKAFDSLFLSLMRAAEARGGVPETLRRLAKHYEARDRLMRQARSAMIYPVAVLTIAGGVAALLTFFVLPQLVAILEDMVKGKPLPLPTRLLIGLTHFATTYGWWAVPLVLGGAIAGLRVAYRSPAGKGAIDEAALYVPVLGMLLRKIDTTRFARTLSSLLDGGVDVGRSLAMTADVMRLTPFRRAVLGGRAMVKEGTELGEALRASGRFPVDVLAAVDSGEATGTLPETLERVADDYEEQVASMVKNLGVLIQPFLFLAIGGFVLFIAIAFFAAYASVIMDLAGGI